MSARSLTRRAILSHIEPNHRRYLARTGPNGTNPILEWDDRADVHAVTVGSPALVLTLDLERAGYAVTVNPSDDRHLIVRLP